MIVWDQTTNLYSQMNTKKDRKGTVMNVSRKIGKRLVSFAGLSKPTAISLLDEIMLLKARIKSNYPKQRRKLSSIQRSSEIRLNIGCGLTRYTDWIGVDMCSGEATDLILDLRRSLPFSNETVDYCYSEHFAEHLYPEEFDAHLKDVHRILRKGGIYRLVVPHAQRFFQNYIEENDDYFKQAFPWANSNLEAVYCMCNWHGIHRSIFDIRFVTEKSLKVGFSTCMEVGPNESNISNFSIPVKSKQRELESLYIEIEK